LRDGKFIKRFFGHLRKNPLETLASLNVFSIVPLFYNWLICLVCSANSRISGNVCSKRYVF